MPEVNLKVKWPSDQISDIYSPSTIIHQYFSPGDSMTVSAFVNTCSEALHHASKRVEQRYGYACSSAMSSLDSVQRLAKTHSQDGIVEVLALS